MTGALKKPYIKLKKAKEDGDIIIDETKLEEAKQYDGYFGLRANIKDAKADELLSYYRGLWQVEQSFRISKHNLEIRPVFYGFGSVKASGI